MPLNILVCLHLSYLVLSVLIAVCPPTASPGIRIKIGGGGKNKGRFGSMRKMGTEAVLDVWGSRED